MSKQDAITVEQAAEMLGCETAHTLNLVRKGEIKSFGEVDYQSVLAYIERRNKGRINNLDKILATLKVDDGLTDDERGWSGGKLPPTGLVDLERAILKMRGENYLTLDAIAVELDLNSRERVSQIIRRAIKRLATLKT